MVPYSHIRVATGYKILYVSSNKMIKIELKCVISHTFSTFVWISSTKHVFCGLDIVYFRPLKCKTILRDYPNSVRSVMTPLLLSYLSMKFT